MTLSLSNFLLVGLGGAMGAMIRFLAVSLLMPHWGVMMINVLGSFLMGLLAGFVGPLVSPEMRLFLGTGLLGGFTTFSAFSLDVGQLVQSGQYGLAGIYVLGSVILSLLVFFFGFWLTHS